MDHSLKNKKVWDIQTSSALPASRVQLKNKVEPEKLGRAAVNAVKVSTQVVTSKPKHVNKSKVLNTLIAFILIVGVCLTFNTWHTNHQAGQARTHNGQPTGDNPSENKPYNLSDYRVAPDLPRFIYIDKLNIKARVTSIGVLPDNQLDAPTNIYDAGWYSGSARPGQSGAMLLDGHVHGPTKTGVFYRLTDLSSGDKIKIERGDGRLFTFKVVKLVQYPYNKVNMTAALSQIVPGKNGLNLITCGGRYNSQISQYDKRTVVFAVQI